MLCVRARGYSRVLYVRACGYDYSRVPKAHMDHLNLDSGLHRFQYIASHLSVCCMSFVMTN